jgi:hypothetical protein
MLSEVDEGGLHDGLSQAVQESRDPVFGVRDALLQSGRGEQADGFGGNGTTDMRLGEVAERLLAAVC